MQGFSRGVRGKSYGGRGLEGNSLVEPRQSVAKRRKALAEIARHEPEPKIRGAWPNRGRAEVCSCMPRPQHAAWPLVLCKGATSMAPCPVQRCRLSGFALPDRAKLIPLELSPAHLATWRADISPTSKSYVIQHVHHAVRAAKSMFVELFHKKSTNIIKIHKFCKHRRRNKSHVHHSSSHIIPIPEPPCDSEEFFDVSQCLYYDATWNSMISAEDMDGDHVEPRPPPVEKKSRGRNDNDDDNESGNEIDRLAEKFIASCHEKFRLEKQESYRRYLEMLARSV